MPLVNVMVNSKAYTRSIGPEKCEAQRSGFPPGRATKKIGAMRCR
jgi:hypothetical protein